MTEAVTPRKRHRSSYMREYRARQTALRSADGLLPFQQEFVQSITRDRNPPAVSVLSTPRAQGKSWLCGRLIARSITPGNELFEPGVENILVSSSTNQARIVLEFARAALGESNGYRWRNDGVVHLASRARVRIVSSDARRALGLGASVRLIICDEPAAWAPTSGRRLWDAMLTSLGKRRTQIAAVGTLAPGATTGPASWWHDLVKAGSGAGRHVSLIQADPEKWESFEEVKRVNPVSMINNYLLQALKREHEEALQSERSARTFKAYRLNLPVDATTEAQPLVTASEWERVCARPVPEIEGKPVIGLDLGGSRSWSAATAIWPSGRVEAWAIAPGVPSLSDQERDDQTPEGTYLQLVQTGGLAVDEGRAVPSIERLLARIWNWNPTSIICDNYRAPELYEAVSGRGVRVIERARSGGEATSNIQALRSLLLDTQAGVTESSRALLGAAWSQTNLVISNEGIAKVTKIDARRSREDAAAALLLAAGEQARRPAPVEFRGAVISKSGVVTWL